MNRSQIKRVRKKPSTPRASGKDKNVNEISPQINTTIDLNRKNTVWKRKCHLTEFSIAKCVCPQRNFCSDHSHCMRRNTSIRYRSYSMMVSDIMKSV
ncbi:hypothetical protein TNCT_557431 [Trichonephila clavata]|uniref:Uncharacterized protein n=1 Tax=Trichonephila clavata TaxID=2740835 RepID=A0A8X6HK24_TRICU|nr:hypothetical protein TNCT_557431 [Trichonephila clavata]